MPTITETPVPVWTFCPDGSCLGYEPVERLGLAREISRTAFDEAGPGTINGNAVSTSFFQYLVASGDVDDFGHAIEEPLTCEHCSRDLQVSPTPRPDYPNISGQDPMTLLDRRAQASRLGALERSGGEKMAALEAQVAQLTSLLAGQNAPQTPSEPVEAPKRRKASDPPEAA